MDLQIHKIAQFGSRLTEFERLANAEAPIGEVEECAEASHQLTFFVLLAGFEAICAAFLEKATEPIGLVRHGSELANSPKLPCEKIEAIVSERYASRKHRNEFSY